MSRRARARREAIEAKLLALCPTDETDDMDWEDADYDSLRLYEEISEDSPATLESLS